MSVPDSGEDMSVDTFMASLRFGNALGISVYVFSGGEPTENPKFDQFCELFDNMYRGEGKVFSICSNGMWLKDPDKIQRVKKVLDMDTCTGMQVYTNRQWYREYDYVVRNREIYESISPKVFLTIDAPINMQDLGRARQSPRAQRAVKESSHFMSCLNSTLMAKQLSMEEYGVNADLAGKFCTPSVDAKGNVHMSESRTCPSVGNVLKDSPGEIYEKMRHNRPCGLCAGYRRFATSDDPKLVKAKVILGI